MIQIAQAASIPNSFELADFRFQEDSGINITRPNFAPESSYVVLTQRRVTVSARAPSDGCMALIS